MLRKGVGWLARLGTDSPARGGRKRMLMYTEFRLRRFIPQINLHISLLVYYCNRTEWGLKAIIWHLRATREIMVHNLSPQANNDMN